MSMIQVEHLTFCYDGGIEPVFEDVSFVIDTDWKLGLTGRNGRGKTTLLKLLAGEYEYSGSIRASVEMDCFPFPVGNMSANVIDVIEETDPSCELWKVCRELTCLDMDPEILYRPFTTLSGGEQTRVMLAALFARENAFLLIDEPTNHLDMEARERLMGYLRGKKGFILVSHDRYFLDGCVDHILAINRRNMEVVRGNFTTWQEEKAKKDAFELGENERLKKDIRRLEAAAARTESWSETVEKTKKGVRIGGLKPDRGAIGHKAAKLMKRSKNMESRDADGGGGKEKASEKCGDSGGAEDLSPRAPQKAAGAVGGRDPLLRGAGCAGRLEHAHRPGGAGAPCGGKWLRQIHSDPGHTERRLGGGCLPCRREDRPGAGARPVLCAPGSGRAVGKTAGLCQEAGT